MADQQHRSVLDIVLKDDVSGEAKVMAEAMLKAAAQAKQLDEALQRSGTSQKLQDSLRRIGASVPQVEGATKALRALAEAEGIAADKSTWTANQAKQMKSLELVTAATVRAQIREEAALSKAQTDAAAAAIREADRVANERIRDAERVAAAEARLRERELADTRRHNERLAEERRSTMERMGFGHYVAGTAAMAVSAHGVVSAAEGAAEKGAELQDTRIQLQQAGISREVAAQIEQQALSLSTRYANVGQTAIMELAKEARSVLQNPNEIGPTVETLAAAKSVLDGVDKSGKSSEGLGMLVKGAESIGAAKDPERLRALIDSYVKAIQVMGQTINPEAIYEFDKQAKTAGARMSDRFLMTTGLSLAQEMRGDSAGTGIAAAEKSIAMGFGKNHQAVRNMASVGLIAPEDIDYLKGTHEAKGLKPGRHMVDSETAASDLDLWVYRTMLPALEAHGMKTQGEQLDFVMRTFTGTGADVISKLITQRSAFENHATLYPQAAGIAGADNWDSATKGLAAFNTAMTNLLGNATSPMMGVAGRSLFTISEGLNKLAQAAKDHPLIASAGAVGLTAGGLAASGYVGYQVMNGFGLGASATALDASAAALTTAAGELSAAAALEGGGGGLKKAAEEVAKDAAKVVTGGGAVAAGVTGAVLAAGAGVMAGTIYGLQRMVPVRHPPVHSTTPDATATSAGDPNVTATGPKAPVVSGGRQQAPTASDNSAVGQGTGRGYLHRTAYTTGDDITGLSSAEAMIARGTQAGFEAAFRNLMAGGTMNGLPGGGGMINASYETDDGVTVSGGSGSMRGGRRSSSLPSLRYGRDAAGKYRFTPGADGPVDHFTAAGKTFASKSPDVMRHLMKDFNLGPEQAAVIMGNLGHESQGFTAYHEGGKAADKGGVGWAQWTGSRRREFEAWTQVNHLDPHSDEASYGFLKHELMTNPRYRHALDVLRASKGTPEDLKDFEKVFEGAGVKAYGSRWAYDRKALKALEQDHDFASREPQGPRLPQRAPSAAKPAAGMTTASADPVQIFDHGHLHETIALLQQVDKHVDRIGKASVSVMSGPRLNGQPSQLASRSDVGRHARGVPSTSGSAFV